jgi:hypothetical protein
MADVYGEFLSSRLEAEWKKLKRIEDALEQLQKERLECKAAIGAYSEASREYESGGARQRNVGQPASPRRAPPPTSLQQQKPKPSTLGISAPIVEVRNWLKSAITVPEKALLAVAYHPGLKGKEIWELLSGAYEQTHSENNITGKLSTLCKSKLIENRDRRYYPTAAGIVEIKKFCPGAAPPSPGI